MKAVVAAFNQEKALVGAFFVITNLRMELFGALSSTPTQLIPFLARQRQLSPINTTTNNTSHHCTTTGHAAQQLEASVKQFFVHTFNCSQHGSIEFYETEKILSFSHWQHLLHDLHLVLLKLFVIQPASIFRHLCALHSY